MARAALSLLRDPEKARPLLDARRAAGRSRSFRRRPPWRATAGSMKKPSADERAVAAREGRAEVRERASQVPRVRASGLRSGEAAEFVARLRREYHDATHVAFAWKIGSGASAARRSSDAGEPAGTAGKPIAAAIESAGISRRPRRGRALLRRNEARNGRPLPGLPGSRREGALGRRQPRIIRETSLVVVTCPYDRLGAVRRLVRPPQVTLAGESFEASPTVRLEVVRSRPPRSARRPGRSPPLLRDPQRN